MGVTNKLLQEITEAAAKGLERKAVEVAARDPVLPPPLPRAKPYTDEQLRSFAERMAPQVNGEFVRLDPTTSKNPADLSYKVWKRQQELQHTIVPTREVQSTVPYDPAKWEGHVLSSIVGDPTIGDKEIIDINGKKLVVPSKQEAGSLYGLGEPKDAWASTKNAAKTIQGRIIDTSNIYNAPVLGVYTKGGSGSYSYAHHINDALLKNIYSNLDQMTPKQIQAFNTLIRNHTPEFAGIENLEASLNQFKTNPELRKKFYAEAIKPTNSATMNIPNGSDVVHAALEPDLRYLESGATGHSIMQLDPSQTTLQPATHTTYTNRIPRLENTPVMQSSTPIPYQLQYPDQMQAIMNNPRQAPQPFGTISMGGASQINDAQHVDQISKYLQFMKELTGRAKGGSIHMGAGGSLAEAIVKGVEESAGKAVAPKVNRIDMHFKDVTKRVPELSKGFQQLTTGEITPAGYEALVNQYKPVTPFSFVPKPATPEEAIGALKENQKGLYGVPSQILQEGHPVGLRLDIPAYTNKGVWVPTIHEQISGHGAGPLIGHESVAHVTDPTFGMSQKAAASIAGGNPKGTIATIKGNWKPTTPDETVAKATEIMNDPEWIQVGMDPERHSHFYDRATMEPVVAGKEAIQVGPAVFVKNPTYGKKEDFLYKDGGRAYAQGGGVHMADGGSNMQQNAVDPITAYFMQNINPTNLDMMPSPSSSYIPQKITPSPSQATFNKVSGISPVTNIIKEVTGGIQNGVQNQLPTDIQNAYKNGPQSISDIGIRAANSLAGFPMDIANSLGYGNPSSPYNNNVVPSQSQLNYNMPAKKPAPLTTEAFNEATMPLQSGNSYPALETAAASIGPGIAEDVGSIGKTAVKKGANFLGQELVNAKGANRNLIGKYLNAIDPELNIIKPQGGMLVSGETELERELRHIKKDEGVVGRYVEPENMINVNDSLKDKRAVALNNWIDTKVKKYIRNQAGTENDPIFKAIESGVQYNFDPAMGDTKYMTQVKRAKAGFPEEGSATTDLGKEWQYKVDSIFKPHTAEDIKEIYRNPNINEKQKQSRLRIEHDLPIYDEKDYDALKLINEIPDKNVYTIGGTNIARKLGLDHVADVLHEDLTSGRLQPEQLNQMSIEKAVRRAADYDAQKAREMTKAHATSVEGMPIPKQYDDGFKWVELKHPTESEKTKGALKSEGEMMGHCVGSYCPQVESGHTKIYSLRGPDNKSHVTIEATKKNHLNDWLDANKEEIEKDPLLKQMSYYDADEKYPGMYSEEEVQQAYIAEITKMLKRKGAPVHEAPNSWIDIEQVKGKQNKRPDDKYQKYVTDFIKNNPTGHEIADIHELNNTNLHDVQSMIAEGVMPKKLHMHPIVDKAVGIDQPHLAARMNDPRFSNEITDEKFNLFKNIGRDLANKGQYYVDDEDILNAIKTKYLPIKKAKGGPIDLEKEYRLANVIDFNSRRRYG